MPSPRRSSMRTKSRASNIHRVRQFQKHCVRRVNNLKDICVLIPENKRVGLSQSSSMCINVYRPQAHVRYSPVHQAHVRVFHSPQARANFVYRPSSTHARSPSLSNTREDFHTPKHVHTRAPTLKHTCLISQSFSTREGLHSPQARAYMCTDPQAHVCESFKRRCRGIPAPQQPGTRYDGLDIGSNCRSACPRPACRSKCRPTPPRSAPQGPPPQPSAGPGKASPASPAVTASASPHHQRISHSCHPFCRAAQAARALSVPLLNPTNSSKRRKKRKRKKKAV